MAYEIVNSLRSKSLVRIVGNTALKIALSDLSASNTETVTGAEISQVLSNPFFNWLILSEFISKPNTSYFLLNSTAKGNPT